MSLASSWADVGFASDQDIAAFLEASGLGKHAQKIIEITDAESVGDLRLLDLQMVEDVIKQADLKVIPAQKLRRALGELRGELPGDVRRALGELRGELPGDASPLAAVSAPAETQAVKELPGGGYPSERGVASPLIRTMGAGYPADNCAASPIGAGASVEAAASVPVPLEECIAICIDHSGSMGAPFAELDLDVVKGTTRNPVAQRTRMEAVKAMFYAFRDRVESAGRGGHQLGLIQFDSSVEQLLDLTPCLDRFEAIVDDMEKRGQTAIYSAILKAVEMLEPHFKEDSSVDFRILALTDGQNNVGARPEEALVAAHRIGAVVDAIIVGDRPDVNLRKIVNATGGECYVIGNLGEGFELLEAEGVVSLRARRGGAEKPPFQRREVATDFTAIAEKSLTRGTAVHRAPTLAPTLSAAAVMDVAKVAAAPPPAASRGSGGAMKRTLMELKKVASEGAGEGIHVFPAGDNVFFWRVLLEGPPSTPFEGGVFSLTVEIPEDYPFKAPRILFETPIYHCNVNDSGKICLDILQGGWGPALSVAKALQAVRQLVKEPDTDNALRQWIAELTLAYRQHGDARYTDLATEHTRKDAAKTVADWRAQWGC